MASSERQRARRKPTDNLDAWECYQRGLWYLFSYQHTDEAKDYFTRAISLDPVFSSAHAGLSYAHSINILIGKTTDRDDDLVKGVESAQRGIDIDQSDPFGFFALGRISIMQAEYNKSINAFNRSIALNPNYSLAHFGLAHALWHAGRPTEAIPHHDDAIRLSPHDPILWAFLASKAIALVMTDQFEEGIQASREAQTSNDSQPFSFLGEVCGLGLMGDKAGAEKALNRLKGVQPEISVKFLNASLPMAKSESTDRFLQGLVIAGLN